jgi:selenocysteine-specific elongation factor
MLAGVGGVDACVFVVAATEGWKPQSEEHLRILELLGIRTGSSRSPRSTWSTTSGASSPPRGRRPRRRHLPRGRRPIVPVASDRVLGLDELRAALDELVAYDPTRSTGSAPGCGSTGCSLPGAAAPS